MLKFRVVGRLLVSTVAYIAPNSNSSKSKVNKITGMGNSLFKIKPASSIFLYLLQKFIKKGKFGAILKNLEGKQRI